MWVTKIIIPSTKGMLIGSRTRKNDVSIIGYPLSHFVKKSVLHVLLSACFVGSESNIEKFVLDMHKDKRTVKIDMMNKTFGLLLVKQHSALKPLFDPLIVYIRPIIVSANGEYIIEIASWNKEKLMAVLKFALDKKFGGKLVYMNQKKITNISFTSLIPNLTDKQSMALNLAVENGYYGYPRKTDLGKLAKFMGVSYSTYQFHLRNAEKKVIPYLYKS